MRPHRSMHFLVFVLPLIGGLAACETSVDPVTGQTQTFLTLPGTSANADRAREQWFQCIQFRSESFCERDLGGGRPPGVPPASQSGNSDS